MSDIPGQLLIQVILILLNAFFAATEIAVISLDARKLRKQKEDGDKMAGKLLTMVEKPEGFLSTIQIGITLAGFLGSAFAADNFSERLVEVVYDNWGFQMISRGALDAVSVVVITIILSYFTLVFGELVPKRIAMQAPDKVARLSCRVITASAVVLKPAILFLAFSTNTVLRILHMKTETEEEKVTEEELRMMVELAGENGSLDEEEKEWIQNIFEFDDTSVSEAMTREKDICALPADADEAQVMETIRKSGFSRIPVYQENIHNIVGILSGREFLLNLASEKKEPWTGLIRKAYFVPETIHTDDLFTEMQKRKVHMAIVVNEYGETEGLITIEDLLEEIVGNIYDEFDTEGVPQVQKLEENLWRVKGDVLMDDLAEELDCSMPEEGDFDTVGGLIYHCLQMVPEEDSHAEVECAGLHLTIEKMNKHRIESVLIRKISDN